ncbi:MAG: hypothetical protein AAGI54_00670 [Planctomycetota bacterium]
MALPLTLTLLRDPDLLTTDRLELEIDGVLQPDRLRAQPTARTLQGFGLTPHQSAGFGFVPALPFGEGRFAAGYFGTGATTFTHTTLRSFDAGAYAVRVRAVDPLGNAGPWSDPVSIAHAAPPDPPHSLAVSPDGLRLTWVWP